MGAYTLRQRRGQSREAGFRSGRRGNGGPCPTKACRARVARSKRPHQKQSIQETWGTGRPAGRPRQERQTAPKVAGGQAAAGSFKTKKTACRHFGRSVRQRRAGRPAVVPVGGQSAPASRLNPQKNLRILWEIGGRSRRAASYEDKL